jgi:NADH-ubiquinone oxidoreductase chain 4
MYLITFFGGARARKIGAFFLYTLLGSVLLLLTTVYIYYQIGTTDFELLSKASFTFCN